MTKNRKNAEENFLSDFENHQLIIHKDDGVFRHLEFSKNKSWVNRFFLTTWNGHLCISGDMGTYVFARIDDMFHFFKGEKPNYNYWAEKCESSELRSNYGLYCFSSEVYEETIKGFLNNTECEKEKENIKEEFLGYFRPEYIETALEKIYDYVPSDGDYSYTDDLSPHMVQDFTYHYYWICNAIQKGIELYNTEKEKENEYH